MSATAIDRIRAACERALAALQAHRDAGPSILVETAPLVFPSRPPSQMPEYMHPDFGRRRP